MDFEGAAEVIAPATAQSSEPRSRLAGSTKRDCSWAEARQNGRSCRTTAQDRGKLRRSELKELVERKEFAGLARRCARRARKKARRWCRNGGGGTPDWWRGHRSVPPHRNGGHRRDRNGETAPGGGSPSGFDVYCAAQRVRPIDSRKLAEHRSVRPAAAAADEDGDPRRRRIFERRGHGGRAREVTRGQRIAVLQASEFRTPSAAFGGASAAGDRPAISWRGPTPEEGVHRSNKAVRFSSAWRSVGHGSTMAGCKRGLAMPVAPPCVAPTPRGAPLGGRLKEARQQTGQYGGVASLPSTWASGLPRSGRGRRAGVEMVGPIHDSAPDSPVAHEAR